MKTIEFFLILILVCIVTGSMVLQVKGESDCNDTGQETMANWIWCKNQK